MYRLAFVISALPDNEWSASRLQSFIPGKKSPVPTGQEIGWAPEQSRRFRDWKSLTPTANRTMIHWLSSPYIATVLAEASRLRGRKPVVEEASYLITYLLIPWSKVLLENLTGSQLVKKFPAFYGTRRFITAVTSARHLLLS